MTGLSNRREMNRWTLRRSPRYRKCYRASWKNRSSQVEMMNCRACSPFPSRMRNRDWQSAVMARVSFSP